MTLNNGELFFIGDAYFVEDQRPDVERLKPDFPNAYRGGWGYMLLTNTLPHQGNGTFKLLAKAESVYGDVMNLGEALIHGDNANAVKPFGAIDSPRPGETVSGDYRIIGWALTPPPCKIPENGSTIQVFVDREFIGNAQYNLPRDDVKNLFPNHLNSAGSMAIFDLDTRMFENGLHQLEWSVRDNAGNLDGIGSRYFRILN